MPSRIALVTPFAFPSPRGNAVTVERIARGLRERGVDARVWDASVHPAQVIASEIAAWGPELVHGFHAWRVGPLASAAGRLAGVPLIITLTGTDANHDLEDPTRGSTVREVLAAASAVTAFHASIAGQVAAAVPAVAERVHVVPQAVRLDGRAPLNLGAAWPGLPADRVLFVFPGGIRPVKQPRLPLGPLARLRKDLPALRLLYVGPVLDPAEGDALQRALEGAPWARHIGAVPHAAMAAVLGQADVVLNCSVSEGGMANGVLEALALGRAVLAADIPGNRSLIVNGVTGLLYQDAAGLEAGARRLAGDPGLRRRLGEAGRARVTLDYPAAREIDGYLTLYQSLGVSLSSA